MIGNPPGGARLKKRPLSTDWAYVLITGKTKSPKTAAAINLELTRI
jgi:hypothetical protein